jgi:hypothetical protein
MRGELERLVPRSTAWRRATDSVKAASTENITCRETAADMLTRPRRPPLNANYAAIKTHEAASVPWCLPRSPGSAQSCIDEKSHDRRTSQMRQLTRRLRTRESTCPRTALQACHRLARMRQEPRQRQSLGPAEFQVHPGGRAGARYDRSRSTVLQMPSRLAHCQNTQ